MINYIYRRPGQAYSIENVFDLVFDEVSREHACRKTFMRFHRANVKSIVSNIAQARGSQGALNHVTGDVMYTMLGLHERHINILTIHDLVTLRKLRGWKHRVAKELWYVQPMRRASAVTTISRQIANDLIELYPSVESKLHVIHNPVSPLFSSKGSQNALSDTPRVLHIGTKPNKNLPRVLAALSDLNIHLSIVGRICTEDRKILRTHRVSFEEHVALSDEAVVEQYAHADMVLFPSLYEGFGLPIVEANAMGTPVITSRLEPMMEVAGNAAIFVDPCNILEIRQAVVGLSTNSQLRADLVRKGLANAQRFQPTRIAASYMSVYESQGYRRV